MKEFAAGLLLIVVIAIGWHQPFKAHFQSIAGPAAEPAVSPSVPAMPAANAVPRSQVAPIAPAATPAARDAAWMWKKTEMDAPHPAETGKQGGKRGH